MNNWFDILYRREEPVTIPCSVPGAENTPPPGASGSAQRLLPTAPLRGLPGRWALEVQKIAIHLRGETDDTRDRCLLFTGMQRKCGTTTICYLVAHHMATERNDRRVLHLDFNSHRGRQVMPGTDLILTVGEPLSAQMFDSIQKTFARLAIRPGENHSVAATAGWMRELIVMAREYCDWVFVDAPPFFAAPETYGVAKACDGVVIILKSGESRYPALNALITDLDALGIKVVGTILNFRQYPIPNWLLKYI